MFGKHSSLLRLIVALGLLLLVTVSLVAIPGLREIGRGNIEEATSRLQRGNDANIEVTSAPFSLPDYMWDIEVKDGETTDLRPLIPSVATLVPGILAGSGIRIHVGQVDSAYNLEFQWDTDSSNTMLELTLFDSLERPLGYWRGISGNTGVILPGGLYKLVVSSDGLLGEDFKLAALATRTTETPKFEIPNVRGIPTIDIKMSEATFQSWDIQRAAFLEALETGNTVDTGNFKQVLAELVTEGGQSTVQLWAAGIGDPAHFSPEAPSFTGRVVSGPLLFGMSRFKLYTIRTQEGLLNHVVYSIMYDEGIFVPRWMMVRVSLNNRSLGLYLLVETPQSQGFFAGVQRYDGQIVGSGILHADPLPPAGLVEQKSILGVTEYSLELVSSVNKIAFAKSLAFLSRCQGAHGTQGGDFRMYRHPYLDIPEPIIRDANAGIYHMDEISLLAHTSWWLGPSLIGRGPHFNPKVFPMDTPLSGYAVTPWTINLDSVHPAAKQFVKLPENRELFDQYLFYACDEAFQRRFAARIQSAFESACPYLSIDRIPVLPGGAQPYQGFDSELGWVSNQIDTIVSGQTVVLRTIPLLVKQSVVLISVDPPEPAPAATPETRIFSLYNLSPFSARLKLPDYAHIAEPSLATTMGNDALGWYLAPSLLFPTVIPVAPTESKRDLDPFLLTQEAAQRLLRLERLRFQSQSSASTTPAPFIDVQIPADRFNDFISVLETDSVATLASIHTLPADKNILISQLPAQEKVALQSEPIHPASSSEYPSPDVVILPLSLEQVDPFATRLSLLVSNFSHREVSLDLSSLRWMGVAEGEGDVPYSIHAIWKLGDKPSRVEPYRITLGPTNPISGLSMISNSSPMIWTGALQGLLDGSLDEAMPNCLLVEFDLETSYPWICVDANELAEAASTDVVQITVVIHEPYNVYLPIKPLETQKILGYQSPPASTTLSVSSSHETLIKEYLIDEDADTLWHVKYPPESSVHWVAFDFGKPVTIEGLAILPKKDNTQFWGQDNALFQGSNDPDSKAGWKGIARLFTDKAALESRGRDWLRYTLPNATAYRYYRILIDDPKFLSIAEVKFKVKEWVQPVVNLTVAELIEQGVLKADSASDASLKTIRFKNKDSIISGVVTIPAGYVLELEPGSTLRFTRKAGLLSYSPIHAIGTAQEPITLSPAEGTTNWLGVAVVNAPGISEFRHVQMSQAIGGILGDVQVSGGLSFLKTSVIIADTELCDFLSEDGLHLHNSSYEITRLTIRRSHSDALDSDWSYGTIADSSFLQSRGGDGVDLCGSWVTITNSTMEGCADKGISIGEGSVANISGVHLIGNRIGIAVKDQAIINLADSEIAGNDYGLLRYIKKPIYIYPQLTLENNQFRGNKTNIHEETPGSWTPRFD